MLFIDFFELKKSQECPKIAHNWEDISKEKNLHVCTYISLLNSAYWSLLETTWIDLYSKGRHYEMHLISDISCVLSSALCMNCDIAEWHSCTLVCVVNRKLCYWKNRKPRGYGTFTSHSTEKKNIGHNLSWTKMDLCCNMNLPFTLVRRLTVDWLNSQPCLNHIKLTVIIRNVYLQRQQGKEQRHNI